MKLYLVFILCVVKTSLTKSSKKSDSKLEGNALIDRILGADKFQELADKIVDMALDKLKNDKADDTPKDTTQNITQLQSIKENPSFRQNKKPHKSKVAKIDIGAVLQKKIMPINDLVFRYERFTKKPNSSTKQSQSKINEKNKKKRQKSSKGNAGEKSGKKGSKHKSKLNSNEHIEKDVSKSKEDSKKLTDLSSENMTYNTKVQNVSSENRFGDDKVIDWGDEDEKEEEGFDDVDKSITEKHIGKKKGSKLKRTTELYIRARTEVDIASHEENYNKEKNEDTENNSSPLRLPDGLPENGTENYDKNETLLLLRANEKHLASNDEEEIRPKQEFDQTDMNSDDEGDTLPITEDGSSVALSEPKENKKRIVRKEGDKLYAFEESPDYAEYHEKLFQLRKNERKSIF